MDAQQRLETNSFLDVGVGSDLNEAFDDAVTTAAYEFGHNGAVATLANLENALGEGGVEEIAKVALPVNLAQAAVRDACASGVPGRVYAHPVAAEVAFRRRRVNLNFDDCTVEFGETPGVVALTPTVREALPKLFEAAGVTLEEGETVEEVELRRVRARYKPSVIVHPGRNKPEYAVTVEGHDAVIATASTAGAARRAAVELLKGGGVGGNLTPTLHVSVRARREDGSPLVSITRERIAQKGALRVTLTKEKNPAKRKTVGYAFAGSLDPVSSDSDSETQS